ncbi:hypothetical protein D3C81_1482130 [compost metagenome]
MKIQEVCGAGETRECKRIRLAEVGSFSGGHVGGMFGSAAASAAAGTLCAVFTVGTGGLAVPVCGIVLVGVSGFAGGMIGGKYGESVGELIYELTHD